MVAVGRGEMKLEVKCVWWNTSDPVETTVKRGATGVDLCLEHCESRTEGDLSINVRLDVAFFPGKLLGTRGPSGLADTRSKESTATEDN